MSVLPPIEQKAVYVEQMFSRIAADYDRLNRILTFGLDQGWRRAAVRAVAPPLDGTALDVGCGTGDFLPLLAARMPNGFAVGADYTLPMMQAGQRRNAQPRTAFVDGDALRLPFRNDVFDAITTGFMLRNVTDIGAAFSEMWRVAKPGGRVACLEVARPRNALLRAGHRLYFERVVPLLARVLGADATAYAYLPQSARAFPPPPTLARMMQEAAWIDVRYRLLSFGAVALHTGRKPTT